MPTRHLYELPCIGSGLADTRNPLLPLMTLGLPDVSQVIYKLSVNPLSANSSAKAVNAASALKGPITNYALDFGISLHQVKLDVLPDGNRRVNLEVRAIAYDDTGKPLNMTGQRGSLNLTPKAFEEALKLAFIFTRNWMFLPTRTFTSEPACTT